VFSIGHFVSSRGHCVAKLPSGCGHTVGTHGQVVESPKPVEHCVGMAVHWVCCAVPEQTVRSAEHSVWLG
jgi:hypothetical protein